MPKTNSHLIKENYPEYMTWVSMKIRCTSPKSKRYKDWGGRGIKVCDRWLGENGFENFLNDVGKRPSSSYSLDRYPNNNGNYEPKNTRWATRKEQQRNRRNNIIVRFRGHDYPISELAEKFNIDNRLLKSRLRSGENIEVALLRPIGRIIKNPTVKIDRSNEYGKWAKMYNAGLSIPVIADIFHCSLREVTCAVKRGANKFRQVS